MSWLLIYGDFEFFTKNSHGRKWSWPTWIFLKELNFITLISSYTYTSRNISCTQTFVTNLFADAFYYSLTIKQLREEGGTPVILNTMQCGRWCYLNNNLEVCVCRSVCVCGSVPRTVWDFRLILFACGSYGPWEGPENSEKIIRLPQRAWERTTPSFLVRIVIIYGRLILFAACRLQLWFCNHDFGGYRAWLFI